MGTFQWSWSSHTHREEKQCPPLLSHRWCGFPWGRHRLLSGNGSQRRFPWFSEKSNEDDARNYQWGKYGIRVNKIQGRIVRQLLGCAQSNTQDAPYRTRWKTMKPFCSSETSVPKERPCAIAKAESSHFHFPAWAVREANSLLQNYS